MAAYNQYQPRRQNQPLPWKTWGVVVLAVLVIFLIGRWLIGGSSNNNTPSEDTDITLLGDANINSASTSNENSNINVAINGNINAAAVGSTSWQGWSVKSCPTAISSWGEAKKVALTFDLAADNEAVRQTIDILKQQGIPASFFSTGTFAEKYSGLVKDIAAAGFGVYNHGYQNDNYSTLSAASVNSQLTKGATAITAATGVSPQPLFRPPYGDFNETVTTAAAADGYCTVLWTVDSNDWQKDITADAAKTRILNALRPGAIVLLHAGYDTVPLYLADLATAITGQGYQLVTMADLMAGS